MKVILRDRSIVKEIAGAKRQAKANYQIVKRVELTEEEWLDLVSEYTVGNPDVQINIDGVATVHGINTIRNPVEAPEENPPVVP